MPPPDDRQRVAIAEHLAWLMAFLEAHHRSEDLGLYPVVRERDPGAAALLDDMARDHEVVAAAIVDVERGRPRPTPSATNASRSIAALDDADRRPAPAPPSARRTR